MELTNHICYNILAQQILEILITRKHKYQTAATAVEFLNLHLYCDEYYAIFVKRFHSLRINKDFVKQMFKKVVFTLKFPKLGKYIVKLRQGSGKDRQGMAVKAKGLKA